MPSKNITVDKVEAKQFKSGARMGQTFLAIGHNTNGMWINYRCEDQSLFGLLTQGAHGLVEYEEQHWQGQDGAAHVTNKITGFAPGASGAAPIQDNAVAGRDATGTSIEKQVCIKVAGELLGSLMAGDQGSYHAETLGTIAGVIANQIHEEVFGDKLAVMKDAATRALDAHEYDSDDDIPFG